MFAVLVVDFVGDKQHRFLGATQQIDDLAIGSRQTGLRVREEEDQIGLVNRHLGLRADERNEGDGVFQQGSVRDRPQPLFDVGGQDFDAARIHEKEIVRIPFRFGDNAVARGARNITDHRSPFADNTIK